MFGTRSCSSVIPLLLALAALLPVSSAQPRADSDLEAMLSTLVTEHDIPQKEAILNRITSQFGEAAGPSLLDVALEANDSDTRWMAIRGIGYIKFQRAAQNLIVWLTSPEHYVRANAARALGELRYSLAGPALIRLLAAEQDAGVIEQTSLALRMIKAQDAIPTIKSRMSFDSLQTRCWLLDAIAGLGSKDDVPFVAKYLYSSDAASGLPLCASRALSTLTGEDFGLSKNSGLFDPQAPVLRARKWWEQAQKQYGPQ